MKKYCLLLMMFMTMTSAFAEESQPLPLDLDAPAPKTKMTRPKRSDHPNPCAVIERACKSAGIEKWITRDCVDPVLAGHNVPGVNIGDVSLEQVKVCKMSRSSKK